MKTNEVNKEISYETLLVTFGEGIGRLNTMFDDPQVWGVATLKQWIDGHETTRLHRNRRPNGGYHIRIQHGQREGMAAKEHTDYQPGKTIKSCASINYSSATGCWGEFSGIWEAQISPLKA